MRRTASEVIRELETRIAQLEGKTAGREYDAEKVARLTTDAWDFHRKLVFMVGRLGSAGVGRVTLDEMQEAVEALEKALYRVGNPDLGPL